VTHAARALTLAMATLAVVVAGCGSGDQVTAAPQATAAACTALSARLPATVLDRARGTLNVTGAAAWGDPAIVLRCGVASPGPTTDQCIEADGVDWVFTETKEVFRFVSYGRTPGVEVTVPTSIDRTTAPGVLADLADAVRSITTTTKCI
jgi:hypothetical protein